MVKENAQVRGNLGHLFPYMYVQSDDEITLVFYIIVVCLTYIHA